MVQDLLLANGSTYKNPAANYYRVSSGPVKEGNRNIGLEVKTDAATESATQLFLGVRFSCNKCHDHPFEKWTQNQYYEFSSFFSPRLQHNWESKSGLLREFCLFRSSFES